MLEFQFPVFWEVLLFPGLAFPDGTSKYYSYHLLPKTISLEPLSSSMVVFLPVKPSFPRARSGFFPSQLIRIDQVRVSRSYMESGLALRTTTTGTLQISNGIYLDGTKEWSVSLSGLPRLRTVGPHQKLGRREASTLLGITQSSRWLSHLDVTQTSGIMMSLSSFPPEVRPNLRS